MPLPPKTVEVDRAAAHNMRTIPPKFEEWLAAQGYCVRLMSNDDGMAALMASEECRPFRVEDLPDPAKVKEGAKEETGKLRAELLRDLLDSLFTQKEEGTFERGDVRIFVQGVEIRDASWQRQLEEMREQESIEAVYGQIDGMNEELTKHEQGGVVPGYVQPTNVANVSAHASGGRAELARNLSMQQLMDRAGQHR